MTLDLDAITARALEAQVGRLPTGAAALAHTLTNSTATRKFVSTARSDVLALAGEVRQLREIESAARALSESCSCEQDECPLADAYWRNLGRFRASLDGGA